MPFMLLNDNLYRPHESRHGRRAISKSPCVDGVITTLGLKAPQMDYREGLL